MIPIAEIMTKEVITVLESTPIYEAMDLLMKHKISGVPVVDEEMKLKGILSEKDVLRILVDNRVAVHDTVSEYMSRNVVSFPVAADAIEICRFFIRSNIRRVPIVDGEKLVGVVSRRDIVEVIVEARSKLTDHRFN